MRARGLAAVAAVSAAALGAAAVSLAGPEQAPTWQRDVAPIVAAKCLSCHVPGGIAPFSLRSYADARKRAAAIAAATSAGLMPPWPPSSRSPRFVGQDRRILNAREKAVLARWAKAGAPR